VGKPVNVVMGRWNPNLTLAELEAAGVKRVSVGGALARAAWGGFLRAVRQIREHGTFSYDATSAATAELNGTFSKWKRS
jgi:methylisocitrate lyase